MKRRFLLFLILNLFILSSTLFSQSIKLVYKNTIHYPTISAEFLGYDKSNTEVRNYSSSDILLYDNNIKRNVTVTCGDASEKKVSIIFALDVSGTMSEKINGATKLSTLLNAIKSFLNDMPDDRFEAYILGYNMCLYEIMPFSHDKNDLNKILDDFPIEPVQRGDWNAAFLDEEFMAGCATDSCSGALFVAQKALYKPFVVFFSDGFHNVSDNVHGTMLTDSIIRFANSNNVGIYTFSINFHEDEGVLSNISKSTNGIFCDSVVTAADYEKALNQIVLPDMLKKGSSPPCIITWASDCAGGATSIQIPKLDSTKINFNYNVPDEYRPYLKFTPNTYNFTNIPGGSSKEQNIIITAKNNFIDISGSGTTNNKFIITNWGGSNPPFTLKQDSSRTITVKYTSIDSSFYSSLMTINSSACGNSAMTLKSGWVYAIDLDMGSVLIGSGNKKTLKSFVNKSGDPISLTRFSLPQGSEFNISAVPTPAHDVVIPNDTSVDITWGFYPTAVGIISDTFDVICSDVIYHAKIFGKGVLPDLSLKTIDLNDVVFGKSIDTLITAAICNTTTATLTIGDINILGANPSDFTILNKKDIPYYFPPDTCINIEIRFSPKELGIRTAVITIKCSDSIFTTTITGTSVDSIVSVNEINYNSDIHIYPNPANDYVTLLLPNGYGYYVENITVVNSLGIKLLEVKNENLDRVNINIESLLSGVYFINFTYRNKLYNIPFFVKR